MKKLKCKNAKKNGKSLDFHSDEESSKMSIVMPLMIQSH